MKISRDKTKSSTAALLFVLTMAATLVALPTANAHTPPWDVRTYAFVTVEPDPIGVGQTALVVFWLDIYPPTAAGKGGDRWRNLEVEVTKPNGDKQTLGPFTSDPVGSGFTQYTPDQVGTYTFEFSFPGQVLSLYGPTGIEGRDSPYINDTYLASSATTTLTVQQDPIPDPPSFPLPTSFWTRPIEGQNTEWWKVASNYLSGSSIRDKFQPDGIAPNSPHIMWTKPLSFGGVVGGSRVGAEGMTFYDGSQYENKFMSPVIISGRLYYDTPLGHDSDDGPYVCVDLVTGETLWENPDIAPTFGQLYDYESMNQHGVIPNGYLWQAAGRRDPPDTPWKAYDPFTGELLYGMTDVPSGTEAIGPQGEIVRYVLNVNNNWLALWNNTCEQQGLHGAIGTSSSAYQWRPIGKTVNMSQAYTWNVTIPTLPSGSSIRAVYDDRILGSAGSFGGINPPNEGYTMWAISLEPETRGDLLWMEDYAAQSGNLSRSFGPYDPCIHVFTMWDKETVQWSGYSADNGSLLWGPTPSENPWNFYAGAGGALLTDSAAYGKLFSTGYSGIVYCYDLTTGKQLWTYSAPAGLATPYGGYPLGIAAIADEKIYFAVNEHSSGAPYWKGSELHCVDVNTGDKIWTIYAHGASSWGGYGYAVADGYLVFLNVYDMQIYCIGKGPSATTVTAPDTVVPLGSSVVIRGTVTDQTPAAKDTPAISDESMGPWMEYLYMQKPCPADATGVPVTLDAFDPNNNFIHIGTVTSDMSGMFSHMWTPDIEGKYTVIATFEGSESYYASYAETAVGVGPAPEEPPAEEPEEAPAYTAIDLAIIAAVVVAIIIGIVNLWALRKRT